MDDFTLDEDEDKIGLSPRRNDAFAPGTSTKTSMFKPQKGPLLNHRLNRENIQRNGRDGNEYRSRSRMVTSLEPDALQKLQNPTKIKPPGTAPHMDRKPENAIVHRMPNSVSQQDGNDTDDAHDYVHRRKMEKPGLNSIKEKMNRPTEKPHPHMTTNTTDDKATTPQSNHRRDNKDVLPPSKSRNAVGSPPRIAANHCFGQPGQMTKRLGGNPLGGIDSDNSAVRLSSSTAPAQQKVRAPSPPSRPVIDLAIDDNDDDDDDDDGDCGDNLKTSPSLRQHEDSKDLKDEHAMKARRKRPIVVSRKPNYIPNKKRPYNIKKFSVPHLYVGILSVVQPDYEKANSVVLSADDLSFSFECRMRTAANLISTNQSIGFQKIKEINIGPIVHPERDDVYDASKAFMAVRFKEFNNFVLKDKVTSNNFDPQWKQTQLSEQPKDYILFVAEKSVVDDMQDFLESHKCIITNKLGKELKISAMSKPLHADDFRHCRYYTAAYLRSEFPDEMTAPSSSTRRTMATRSSGALDVQTSNEDNSTSRPKRRKKPQYDPIGSLPEDNDLFLLYPPEEDAQDVVTLNHGDIRRVKEPEFLNDSLIDFQVKFWVKQLPAEKICKVHAFSSLFYTKLTEVKNPKRGYELVKRWTKNIDLFALDFVLIPINESTHWSLAVIVRPGLLAQFQEHLNEERQAAMQSTLDLEGVAAMGNAELGNSFNQADKSGTKTNDGDGQNKPCILIMDSLRLHNHTQIAWTLRSYITSEWQNRKVSSGRQSPVNGNADTRATQCAEPEHPQSSDPGVQTTTKVSAIEVGKDSLPVKRCLVPQQANGYDCGMYVGMYAKKVIETWPPSSAAEIEHRHPFQEYFNEEMFDQDAIDQERQIWMGTLHSLRETYLTVKENERRQREQEEAQDADAASGEGDAETMPAIDKPEVERVPAEAPTGATAVHADNTGSESSSQGEEDRTQGSDIEQPANGGFHAQTYGDSSMFAAQVGSDQARVGSSSCSSSSSSAKNVVDKEAAAARQTPTLDMEMPFPTISSHTSRSVGSSTAREVSPALQTSAGFSTACPSYDEDVEDPAMRGSSSLPPLNTRRRAREHGDPPGAATATQLGWATNSETAASKPQTPSQSLGHHPSDAYFAAQTNGTTTAPSPLSSTAKTAAAALVASSSSSSSSLLVPPPARALWQGPDSQRLRQSVDRHPSDAYLAAQMNGTPAAISPLPSMAMTAVPVPVPAASSSSPFAPTVRALWQKSDTPSHAALSSKQHADDIEHMDTAGAVPRNEVTTHDLTGDVDSDDADGAMEEEMPEFLLQDNEQTMDIESEREPFFALNDVRSPDLTVPPHLRGPTPARTHAYASSAITNAPRGQGHQQRDTHGRY